MATKKKNLAVLIRREGSGQVYSEVVDKDSYHTQWPWIHEGVVVDRAKGNRMTIENVIARAEMLARLLDIPVDKDLTWPCLAKQALTCHCPICVAAGRC